MTTQHVAGYSFEGGFPTPETIQKAYNDADLNRAIQAYRFFYPAVSAAATWNGNLAAGLVPNEVFGILEGNPRQIVLTPSSDTPNALVLLDLRPGPIVVDIPPGAPICVVNDLNQRYVMDLGVPGPDKGRGGLHLIIPPDYRGTLPGGYHVGRSSTYRALLALRAIPPRGDVDAAIALMKKVRLRSLDVSSEPVDMKWIDLTPLDDVNLTAGPFETTLDFWRVLHEIIDTEPALREYHDYYGELAVLGIVKGKSFNPDVRMKVILERAAEVANAQMRVQSFADRRSDRTMWPDRKWEWAALRPENGDFELPSHKDLDAREKWFFQAVIESPAMFGRSPGTGSLCWLGLRDRTGTYLDGAKTYRLVIPLPVPAALFWSVTIYDPLTRSEIQNDEQRAAMRSQFELAEELGGKAVELYFGPTPASGHESRWLQTIPGRGWFSYFRVYGPMPAAFDGSWRPGDFQLM
jgi:hypothetical protein